MKVNGFQKKKKEETLKWLKKQAPKYEELKYFKEAKIQQNNTINDPINN